MTRGQPARDALDAIDEAVARISDAEVDRHLAKILRQGGFRGSSVPLTEAPLRLKGSPGGHGPARLTRLGGWAAPLAAAAAVVLVVICAAAGSWLFRSLSSRPGDSGAPARGTPLVSFTGAPAGPYAGVPAYYVEIANPSLAVVRATATGATLARIATRTPFVGVTGGADDRTFVLDAQRSIMGPAVRWPGHPAFYLLRLSSSGAEESFTKLNIAAPPDGAAVAGMALSPDSSKLAVALDTGTPGAPGLLEIRVYTLATGAFRTWSAHGLADSQAPEGFTGSGVDASESISWAADSRTLAFDVMNQNLTRGVRLLDTKASGSDLIADSRLAVTERAPGGREALTSKDHVSQCVTNSIISADGSAIVCGYTTDIAGLDKTTGSIVGLDTTTGFIRYSASTGKQTAVLGVHEFKGQAGGDISLYWVNSTGNILIGGVLTPGGIRVGVINGEKFTPLPGITHLGAAAW
jgi:hypothetical protein